MNPANISTSPEKFREYRFRDFPNKRLLANSVRVLLFLRRLKHILKKFTFDRFLNWKCHPIGIQSNFNVLRTLLITKESKDQKHEDFVKKRDAKLSSKELKMFDHHLQ